MQPVFEKVHNLSLQTGPKSVIPYIQKKLKIYHLFGDIS